jgi:surface antigen
MPSPVSAVALSATSGAPRQDIAYCDRKIEVSPPTQDVTSDNQCGPYYAGQCVAYAECRSGYHPTNGVGRALDWKPNIARETVQPGDVVIFTTGEYKKFGHVAFVESVTRDASGRLTGVNIAESNNGLHLKFAQFPNVTHICGATDQYGVINRRPVPLDDQDTFSGVFRPNNAPGQFLPPLTPGVPALHVAATSTSQLKAGDSADIVGQNFSRNSRISLLLTAPGAAETVLVSFTSDANGGFHYPFAAACNAKAGAYSIRALDQAPAGSNISGRKSDPLGLTVAGKATHCILGIPAAQASSKPSGPAPVLNPVTPASHPAGQFSIDLYGSGFQPGAKLIARGTGWSSDKAAVTYLAPDHLRAIIDAPNPAQFSIAVQNPDNQISVSQPIQVITGAARGSSNSSVSTNVPPHGSGSAPVPASANAPVLSQVTPNSHTAGKFSIDLYGTGFQPGAKLIAQGAGWSSDQAAVMYLGADHLRAVIDAANAAQFTITVRNPDSQVSVAYPFQVMPATTAVTTKSTQTPAVGNATRSSVPTPSTPAPVGAPANAGSTVSSAHSTNIPIAATPLNTPTPLKQPVIVNSTPVQPNHGSPMVSAPQIKPTPIPVQTIKPMPPPQPNVASYPANTNTAKPVLRPPSSTTPMSTPSQMPGSTIPAAPGIKPAGPPASAVNTVRPTSPPMAPPHPTPAPVVKAQPQPFTPPVRVAPTPTPVPRTYSPPPPAPRTLPQPTPVPHAYTPPPPPPRAVPQPTPVPQPTKTPTPKKP